MCLFRKKQYTGNHKRMEYIVLDIKVFGAGCPSCEKLENLCRSVLEEMNIEANVERIDGIDELIKWNIPLTPALMLNGVLKCSGKIPLKSTLEHWIKDAANKGGN